VTRFPSANHLWSYAGYDPIINDSGNGRYHGPISRRGSPYLRVTLFQMGVLASRHNPATARVYVRARDRGVGDVKRMQHAACRTERMHTRCSIPHSILHFAFSILHYFTPVAVGGRSCSLVLSLMPNRISMRRQTTRRIVVARHRI
jgi:hypothetical protein